MLALLLSVSGANEALKETFEDLPLVLEQAISVALLEAAGCQFCPKARDIKRYAYGCCKHINISDSHSSIADRIQIKCDGGGLMEEVLHDCRMLKELLQASLHVQPMNNLSSPHTCQYSQSWKSKSASADPPRRVQVCLTGHMMSASTGQNSLTLLATLR